MNCPNCQYEVDRFWLGHCQRCYRKIKAYDDPNGSAQKLRLARFPEKLTEQQANVLAGLMLGDGHLHKTDGKNTNARLSICRAIRDVEYLKWQHDLYRNVCNENAFSTYHVYDNRINKYNDGCKLQTAMLPLFTEYHSKWYRKDRHDKWIKIVPNDLTLNTEIIA